MNMKKNKTEAALPGLNLKNRKIMDQAFSSAGYLSIFLLFASLIVILAPIFVRGSGAFIFKGTIEFRRLNFEKFARGSKEELSNQEKMVRPYREKIYSYMTAFEQQLEDEEVPDPSKIQDYETDFKDLKEMVHELLGPVPGEPIPVMMRDRFGKTRWDQAEDMLHLIKYIEKWDYSDKKNMGKKVLVPREKEYEGTALAPMFSYLETNLENIMLPELTFYWQFLTDTSFDAHLFGGIGAEVLGTIYPFFGAMLFSIPMGVIAAVYLTEFAKEGRIVSLLRTFVSTLAGVPSIVFGLFGLAFFINTVKVSSSKSVLAGSLTLALLVLPTIIRASEEAIRSVPRTYKEAALSLGAGKLRTVWTVILPAALPGILTGIVISMGRAAGETAPIIFTAAVSVGRPLSLLETLNQPTPALPWNIYNLVTEHEAVEQIRHVQFGMVLTLILIVLTFNLAAIIMRARISKKLRG